MRSILLVDDNEDLRELYGTTLRRAGYVVQEAENGERAIAMLESMEGEPCLLLLDLMMPVMNGAEVLKVLFESGQLTSLPVIVLSAGGTASDAPEARRFIKKPVSSQVLLALVREFCAPDSSD